jgi:hypothetical protein
METLEPEKTSLTVKTNLLTVTVGTEGEPNMWGIDENSEIGDIYGLELIGKNGNIFDFNLKKLYHQSK